MPEVDYSQFYYKNEKENSPISPDEIAYVDKKTKPKKQKGKTLAILCMILCFCATLFLADYFSGGYILADFDARPTVTIEDNSYYCVQTGMYTDQKTAELYAQNVKARGGAGYVYYDGTYRVIASIYQSALQAKTVAEKMESTGVFSTVFSFSLSPTLDESLTQSDRDSLLEISNYADYVYQRLYELSNQLDAGAIEQKEIKSVLDGLISYLDGESEKLAKIKYSTPALSLSSSIKGAIDIIKSVPSSPTPGDIRYAYTAILCNRI